MLGTANGENFCAWQEANRTEGCGMAGVHQTSRANTAVVYNSYIYGIIFWLVCFFGAVLVLGGLFLWGGD